jgi:hypothetical protein
MAAALARNSALVVSITDAIAAKSSPRATLCPAYLVGNEARPKPQLTD